MKATHYKKQKAAGALLALAVLAAPVLARAESVSYGGAGMGTNSVPVTVEYGGTAAKAMIPKSLSFHAKTGSYTVFAYMESDGVDALDTSISITPSASFTLTKSGSGDTVTASVSQEKTVFTPQDRKNGEDSTVMRSQNGGAPASVPVKRCVADGTITAEGITNGTWTGTMTFNVQ